MQRIGRYEIIEELGRGAMGAVYKARDPQIGRTVAIKIILTAGLTPDELTQYKQRFYREAQTAGQVNHPGIVTIHDIAEDEKGQPYLVMEFVEGVTLHRMLRPAHSGHLPERLPVDQALDLVAQVAEALDFAHKRGVVHRDIKPGNVLITAEGRAKIADFGIAKFTDSEATRTTTVLGTPAYMAPEQLRGGTVDARSDIFSVGAMLFWMLTGQKPFPGEDLTSVSFKVVYTDPANPTEIVPDLPGDLDTVSSRCLAKNPHDRYATAKDLANDLQAVREGKPVATTAAPRGSGPEPTVSTMPGRMAPAGVLPAPVKAKQASAPKRPLHMGYIVAILLAAVLGLVTYMILPDRERVVYVPVPQQPGAAPAKAAGSRPPAAKAKSEPGSAAAGTAADGPAQTNPTAAGDTASGTPDSSEPAPLLEAAPRALTSGLEFECKHDFRNATLAIYMGEQKVVDSKLEKKGRWVFSSGGKVGTDKPIPVQAGMRQLRVHVVSVDEKEPYNQEALIDGEFPEGGARRLLIEFVNGQLQVRWGQK